MWPSLDNDPLGFGSAGFFYRRHHTARAFSRRDFITLLGVVTAWPLAVRAQQPAKVVRLGYLAPARLPNLIEALRAGLRDFGYVEGQNLTIEYRFALDQTKSYDELAQELVSLDPAAIVLTGTPAALALKRQTTTIPIILAPIADPIALGLARSLSRPGGNVTGVTMYGTELAHKRMEILREAAAGTRRVAVSLMRKIRYIPSCGMTSSRSVLCLDWSSASLPFQTSTNFRRCSRLWREMVSMR